MQHDQKQILIITILLLFLVSYAFADSLIPNGMVIKDSFVPGMGKSIGKVCFVKGKVYVVHNNQDQLFQVVSELPLYSKDKLFVLKQSAVNMSFNDQSILTLGPQSKITLDKMDYVPAKKHRVSYLNMHIGQGRFRIKKYKKYINSSFRVKTANAIIGVRGSDFIVRATLNKTRVETLKNTKLSLISLAAIEEEPVFLDEFEWAVVEQDMLPSEIRILQPEEAESIYKEFNFEERDFILNAPIINDDTSNQNNTSSETPEQKEMDLDETENNTQDNTQSDDVTTTESQVTDENRSDNTDDVGDQNSDVSKSDDTDITDDKESDINTSDDSDISDNLSFETVIDVVDDPNTEDLEQIVDSEIAQNIDLIDEDFILEVDSVDDVQQDASEEKKETISKMPWYPGHPD